MKKIIDVDKLFEKYLRAQIAADKGKHTEEEWLEKLPQVYSEFESAPLKELDGLSLKEYYADEKDIVAVWLEYIVSGVPLNDYVIDRLCLEDESVILDKMTEDADEEVLLSGIDALRKKGAKNFVNRYIDLLFSKKVCHHVKDELVEDLVDVADRAKPLIFDKLGDKRPSSVVCDLLSRVRVKDERIKRILLDGLKNGDKVPEFSAYLINYDDETCIPEMLEYLSGVTDFLSYRELSNAIEALGGTVDAARDFSDNEDYLKVKRAEDDSNKNKTE